MGASSRRSLRSAHQWRTMDWSGNWVCWLLLSQTSCIPPPSESSEEVTVSREVVGTGSWEEFLLARSPCQGLAESPSRLLGFRPRPSWQMAKFLCGRAPSNVKACCGYGNDWVFPKFFHVFKYRVSLDCIVGESGGSLVHMQYSEQFVGIFGLLAGARAPLQWLICGNLLTRRWNYEEMCSGAWSLVTHHRWPERAVLPAATGPGVVRVGHAHAASMAALCMPNALLFAGLPSPTRSPAQLTALLTHIPWATLTRSEPWWKLGLVWALPSRWISVFRHSCSLGFLVFLQLCDGDSPGASSPDLL